MRLFFVLLLASLSLTSLASTWQPIGPHGAPRMVLKAPDPDGERVYAVNLTGMYRSDDGGATWLALDRPANRSKLPSSSQWSVSPSSPDTIVAVFDDRYPYRSTDGGVTWSGVPGDGTLMLESVEIISSVLLDPLEASRISLFVGTVAFHRVASLQPRWLLSLDGGETIGPGPVIPWPAQCLGTTTVRDAVVATAVDPYQAGSTLLSRVYSCGTGPVEFNFELLDHGDNLFLPVANSWLSMQSPQQIPDSQIVFDQDYFYWKINQYLSRVDRVTHVKEGIHGDVFDVVATGTRPLLASSREGLLASTTAGTQWQPLTNASFGGSGPTAHWAFSAAHLAGGEVIAAGSESVFALAPGSSDWIERSNGLQALPVYRLVVNASGEVSAHTFESSQFGNIPHSGLYATSSDDGETWQGSNISALFSSIYYLEAVAGSATEMYATGVPICGWQTQTCPPGAIRSGGLAASQDGGVTWSAVGPSLESEYGLIAASRSPNGMNTLIVSIYWQASTFLARSHDSGQTWVTGNSGFAPPGSDPVTVRTVVASPADPDAFYIGTTARAAQGSAYPVATAGFYRSLDGGATWQHSSTGLPRFAPDGSHTGVVAIATHPDDGQRLWVLTGERSTQADAFLNRVYRTTDGGDTWIEASAGLPAGDYRSLVADRLRPDLLYVAGFAGAYCTDNGGQRWARLGQDQPEWIRTIAVSEAHVLVGTSLQAAFRMLRPDAVDPIFRRGTSRRTESGACSPTRGRAPWHADGGS